MLPSNAEYPSQGMVHDNDASASVITQASTTIEPDEGFDDQNYDNERLENASTSLTSTMRDYEFENGRRYHKFQEGRYAFPNDDEEQERENMKHAMILNLSGGRLHFAPIGKNPQNIIDVGTGTGVWCMDMGDEYPSASILGIDLSPIQPEWVPPNVRFMVDDAEASWIEGDDFYDYVHGRHITPAIKDFPAFIQKAYKHTKPGGWFEIQEMQPLPHCDDDTMPSDWPLLSYYRSIHLGLAALGISPSSSLLELARLSTYGFINTHHEILKVPIGPWAKNRILKMVGMYACRGINDGLVAMAMGPLCRGLGWTKEEVEVALINIKTCLLAVERDGVHAYLPFHVWYAQKPLEDASGKWELL